MRPPSDDRRGDRPAPGAKAVRASTSRWRAAGAGRPPYRPRDREGPAVLYGWHTVVAALNNPARRFHRLLLTENALRRLSDDPAIKVPLAPDVVRPEVIAASLPPDALHQGLLAEADPLPSPPIDSIPAEGIVLVLDQITDPHNFGAILRSASAFGVHAVVTTNRYSPEATGVLAKAASGALEHVPLVGVTNLSRGLEGLKTRGFLAVGLDSAGEADLSRVPLRDPLALVLGAEGKGLRQLTRATCDVVARLDLPGEIKALNVSNAAAVALYAARLRLAGGANLGSAD